MPTAVLSVSDKAGLADFARGLAERGWKIVSTGGTARVLREAGLEVSDVSEVTGHPEMMDGRVKTLHPAIHAGILARRDRPDDMAALEEQAYEPIDLVAVNLYPFEEAVARGAPIGEAMEQVDIGGPTMLRAAAKNYASVLAVVNPSDYGRVLSALTDDAVDSALRRELARKVFGHTSRYDAAIEGYLGASADGEIAGPAEAGHTAGAANRAGTGAAAESSPFPARLDLRLARVQDLRYGENPDQPAAFYAEPDAPADSLPHLEKLHGKALSFNNLVDIDAAVMSVSPWADGKRPACAIMKHTTPCGLALGDDAEDAYRRALATDPLSAFGGIVALNLPVSKAAAEAMSAHFLEVIVAPGFDDDAVEVLTRKKNLRLIVLPASRGAADERDFKRVRGGFLTQTRMRMSFPEDAWRVATKREPTADEWRDLRFAWRVSAAVKSNAIVLARGEQALGIGAGQMSRVDASRIAVMKAGDRDFDLHGAVVASDAFFPFRDGVDAAAEAGASAIIEPGGSIRDEEVIEAADEHGIAMVFTGRRVFRH